METENPGTNRLGQYLRARRDLVRPDQAGLPDNGGRRVTGLRREEVALLAGISADYYLRLEQGRDRHPSEQVLDAVARALQLAADETRYLYTLAAPGPQRRARPRRPERVSREIQQLLDSWTTTPAYVHGRYMDVLAANRLAIAISPYWMPGTNSLRAVFLEPAMRELHRDWEATLSHVVPYLRTITGPDVDDPRLVELVGELSVRSEQFRILWARHDIHHQTAGMTYLDHPVVGELDLRFQKLAIPGSDGRMLITYHAEPGSPSDERLRLLASWAVDASTAHERSADIAEDQRQP